MGQPGDLLLIFADALVRSWKQITKFKPAGAPAARTAAASDGAHEGEGTMGAARFPRATAGGARGAGVWPACPGRGPARRRGATPAFSFEGLAA